MSKKNKYKLDPDIKDNVEILLYAYPSLQEFCEDHDELIQDFKENGYRPTSKDIIGNEGHGGSNGSTEFDKREAAEDRAWKTYQKITHVEKILTQIKKQELAKYNTCIYYQIIEQYYFEDQTLEKVALKINLDFHAVSRQKERILYKFALKYFGIEVIGG